MDETYKNMIRQSLKMTGMSDEQIEATIAMQQTAMQQAAEAMNAAATADSYFEFATEPTVNTSYQWAIACGADLIHLRGDVINDLTSGIDGDICREILSEQWGIDTRQQFIEMAESLKARRHSAVYETLDKKTTQGFAEEKQNLTNALRFFKSQKWITAIPDMTAWDLGRLVHVTRFALDANLIDRPTALANLRDIAQGIKKHYTSWQQLSTGYQFGRAVWGGLDECQELRDGMEQLLTEKDSPWVTLPFDMPLDFNE
ncbi:MAG: DUF1266 domain-containing protein [Odoribacteraceae bacterium]|jgi:hypothetical protein|nr:DUF1266 domain-containing protein [Odoribacteraceae bacterium]